MLTAHLFSHISLRKWRNTKKKKVFMGGKESAYGLKGRKRKGESRVCGRDKDRTCGIDRERVFVYETDGGS